MRRRVSFTVLLAATAAILSPGSMSAIAAELTRKPVVTTDLLRLRSVSSIDVARDGSRAVLAVRSIGTTASNEAGGDETSWKSYENRSHLFMLDLTNPGRAPVQLTHGSRSDSSPVFSPDGRHIAFIRGDEEAQAVRPQLWVIPADGGEARQVTRLDHGASSPRWSPDGRLIMVTSALPLDEIDGAPPWPHERPGREWNDTELHDGASPRPDGTREEIRAWLARNASEADPLVITRLDFQEERRLRKKWTFRHLFVVNWRDESPEPRRVTEGFVDHRDATFMPDGQHIVYTANKRRDRHPDRVMTNSIWLRNLDGGETREIVKIDGWRFRSPEPGPGGSVLAFLGQQQDEPAFRPWQLGMVSVNGQTDNELVWLTEPQSFDASVRSFTWMPVRTAIYFTAARRGGFPLMQISPGLLKPAPVADVDGGMPLGVHAFGIGGGTVVYAVTSATNPCVVRVRDARGDRLAFDLNEWVQQREISMPVEGWITRPDGTRVQYWLLEPTRREQGKRYPLLLQIHGGPSAMWGPGEMTMWHEMQLFCSWGYAVVYANPRGSGGYGYAFQRANFQNWGDGPAGDVLAAVDHALMNEWIDRDRLVVTGGSYGGYLTAWIVGHDHRFKAAVAQRGVYHLPTFFGEGNAWRLLERAMGGPPFDARYRQLIERESPFTYVSRIRTPMLILHASSDLRTGVSQSEMLYRALKVLERPVEYVRYPGAGHELSRSGDPNQRLDRLNRILEFFERHIDNPREAPVRDPASAAE